MPGRIVINKAIKYCDETSGFTYHQLKKEAKRRNMENPESKSKLQLIDLMKIKSISDEIFEKETIIISWHGEEPDRFVYSDRNYISFKPFELDSEQEFINCLKYDNEHILFIFDDLVFLWNISNKQIAIDNNRKKRSVHFMTNNFLFITHKNKIVVLTTKNIDYESSKLIKEYFNLELFEIEYKFFSDGVMCCIDKDMLLLRGGKSKKDLILYDLNERKIFKILNISINDNNLYFYNMKLYQFGEKNELIIHNLSSNEERVIKIDYLETLDNFEAGGRGYFEISKISDEIIAYIPDTHGHICLFGINEKENNVKILTKMDCDGRIREGSFINLHKIDKYRLFVAFDGLKIYNVKEERIEQRIDTYNMKLISYMDLSVIKAIEKIIRQQNMISIDIKDIIMKFVI